jgi:hypothetical protein
MKNPLTEKKIPCRRIFYRNEDKRKALLISSFVLTLLTLQSVLIGLMSTVIWRLTSDLPLTHSTHETRQDNQ